MAETIRSLGFEVEDLSGVHGGIVAYRRYRLIGSDGRVLDNDGQGFASMSEALKTARAASKKTEP